MLVNKRKFRLSALMSIVCQQVGLPGETLRARLQSLPASLESLENRMVSCAFPPCWLALQSAQNGDY